MKSSNQSCNLVLPAHSQIQPKHNTYSSCLLFGGLSIGEQEQGIWCLDVSEHVVYPAHGCKFQRRKLWTSSCPGTFFSDQSIQGWKDIFFLWEVCHGIFHFWQTHTYKTFLNTFTNNPLMKLLLNSEAEQENCMFQYLMSSNLQIGRKARYKWNSDTCDQVLGYLLVTLYMYRLDEHWHR